MPSSTSPPSPDPAEYDPVFVHSRNEAIIIFGVWVVALLWSVPYCYLNGFPETFDAENLSTTMGIPTWLFWGILVPWLVADVFTTWFCFCYMKEDNLGEAHEDEDLREEIAEMHAEDAARQQEGR